MKKIDAKKFAVFVPNKPFFGATLCQIPFFHQLKLNFPNSIIRVYSPIKDIVRLVDFKLIDEVKFYKLHWAGLSTLKSLNSFKADVVISLRPKSWNINLIVGLCNSKFKIGHDNRYLHRVLYNKSIPLNTSLYKPLQYFQFLEPLGIKNVDFSFFRQIAGSSNLDLTKNHNYFSLMPCSGSGKFKKWGIENFIRLCKKINEKIDAPFFLIHLGEPEEKEVNFLNNQREISNFRLLIHDRIENIAMAVLKSSVTIANDCGHSHISQMCGGNHIGIFSNHDGQVQERLDEWHWKRKNSITVTSKEFMDIKMIKVDTVFEKIVRFMGNENWRKVDTNTNTKNYRFL